MDASWFARMPRAPSAAFDTPCSTTPRTALRTQQGLSDDARSHGSWTAHRLHRHRLDRWRRARRNALSHFHPWASLCTRTVQYTVLCSKYSTVQPGGNTELVQLEYL